MSISDLTSLGFNTMVIVGIIGISQAIKFSLGLHKNKAKWFIFVPVALGIGAALVMAKPWTPVAILEKTFGYGGAAAILYMMGSRVLEKLTGKK